jgi:hypothetical protein
LGLAKRANMSSEYFCKVALARVNSRGSRQLNKQANAAMKLKKAITGPLGGMLAGAGLAGGVGLSSIRGLQQELAAKAIREAGHVARINQLNNMVREFNAPALGESTSEKLVNILGTTNRALSPVADRAFTNMGEVSAKAVKALQNQGFNDNIIKDLAVKADQGLLGPVNNFIGGMLSHLPGAGRY